MPRLISKHRLAILRAIAWRELDDAHARAAFAAGRARYDQGQQPITDDYIATRLDLSIVRLDTTLEDLAREGFITCNDRYHVALTGAGKLLLEQYHGKD
jgi:hypothetical protein